MIHTTVSWDNIGGYLFESGLDGNSGSDSEVDVSSGSSFEVGMSSLDINLKVDVNPSDIDFGVDARSLDIDFEADARSPNNGYNMELQAGMGPDQDPSAVSVHSFGLGSSSCNPSPGFSAFDHVHHHTPPRDIPVSWLPFYFWALLTPLHRTLG